MLQIVQELDELGVWWVKRYFFLSANDDDIGEELAPDSWRYEHPEWFAPAIAHQFLRHQNSPLETERSRLRDHITKGNLSLAGKEAKLKSHAEEFRAIAESGLGLAEIFKQKQLSGSDWQQEGPATHNVNDAEEENDDEASSVASDVSFASAESHLSGDEETEYVECSELGTEESDLGVGNLCL